MAWPPTTAHAGSVARAKVGCARMLAGLPLAGVVGAVAACGPFRERVCERSEYAVRAITAPDAGRTCVPNDQEPPPGYERFPAGEKPTYLEDDRP